MNNPMRFISMLKSIKKPKEAVISMVKSNNNNPIIKNLVEMAEKGDAKGVENFARNLFKEQNRDFDKEFNDFKSMFNGK